MSCKKNDLTKKRSGVGQGGGAEPRLPFPPVLSRELVDAGVPGMMVEVSQAEAEAMGAFEEDALSEIEAYESSADLPNEHHPDQAQDAALDEPPGRKKSSPVQGELNTTVRLDMTKSNSKRTPLSRERHAQRDFFVADILDASFKDDVTSMEHPLFALKAGDRRVRKYQRGNVNIEVRPGLKGLATIHDKDVWIYCISQLVEAINRGREVSRTVQFTAYDFLVTTNRQTSGEGYRLLADALERLRETSIITNIETAGKRERSGFGLLDSFRVIERDVDNRMVAVSVTLSDWLYRAVESMQVLTLSRDYFRLRKPLDRRIYELARKHCGTQATWRVTVTTLREKSGSTAAVREFRRSVRALVECDELPDYRITLDQEADAVTFHRR